MINDDTLAIELPADAWRQFPNGAKLQAEIERQGKAAAIAAGRRVSALSGVTTDPTRGAYVATFALAPA